MAEKDDDAAGETEALRRRVAELEALLNNGTNISRELSPLEDAESQIFTLLPDAILINRDGKIVFANPAAVKMFGAKSLADLIGMSPIDLAHPDEREAILARRQSVLSGQNLGRNISRRQRLDGSEFITESEGARIIWQGEPALLSMLRDVTEQEQTRKALVEKIAELDVADTNYRLLFEESDFGIRMERLGGERIFVNDMCAKMFGYESTEEYFEALSVPGTMVAPHDRDWMKQNLQSRKEGKKALNDYEYDALKKDGSIMPVQVFVREISWNGETAFLRTILDISPRRRAEKERRESETRFRDLVDGSVLPIQISTVDRSFVYVNQMYLDLLGYESADEFFEFRAKAIAPHDRQRIIDMANARSRGDDVPQIYEYDAITKDGRFIPLQTHSREILWEGKMAYQRTFVDLTERKRTEEQLRQAQKMEVVGQLTGGIAHDFNNILTAITGNLQLAADRLEPTSATGTMVERALDAAWRGATLTQRLLAFSRRQALVPQVIDARALAEGMIDLLQRTLEKSVSVEFMGEDDLWKCDADPSQLENAILNLAINARDAMLGGGKLTIETQNISLDDDYAAAQAEVAPGQYVMIAVTDTGTGMPQDIIDQVFDPFFTTKEIGKGSGLGLSMVFGFVKQSGGHVTVYSEVGVGTTVKLYLPRSSGGEEEPASLPAAPSEVPRGRGETILVVEDEPSVRTLSVALLSDLGYEILEAADGPAALLILETSPHVDLLFTDVVLPGGMRGPELAAEIMRRRPGIAVLYTSGYTENAIVHHGRLDEGVELLNKPFRREDLARRVRAVLDRSHE